MDTSINLRLNAGQARSEAENVRQSVENLVESFEKLRGEGNWSGAADALRKMQEAQGASAQSAGYSAGGSAAGYAGAGSTAQAIKSLEMRIESLTRVSEELAEQLEKAAEGGDYRASYNLSATLNNVDQERRQLQAEKSRLEGTGDDKKGGLENALSVSSLTKVFDLISSGVHVSSNYRQAMAQGDYIGAGIQAKQGVGNILSGIGSAGLTAGALSMNPILLIAGALAKGGGYVLDWITSGEQADKAEAEAFQRSLAPTHGLNKLFFNGSYDENNARAAALIGTGRDAAVGTGLDTYDFLELATSFASYGAKSITEAIEQTRQAALFSNTTGANINGTLSFLGTMRRFGDTDDVLGIANYARGAMGMEKGQTDEFLSSLSRIVEEGIANGYIRSTKDVASTMTMFYRLSDNNPLWQGQYGAERLSRLNSGIAGATSLSKASDVIAYGAAQNLLEDKSIEERSALLGEGNTATGTWIDTMMLLEKGLDANMFGELAKSIAAMEGEGNLEGQIARWKDMTGVNWTMANQLYGMAQRYLAGENIDASEMDKLMEDFKNAPKEGDYSSYMDKYQEYLNKISAGIAGKSQDEFEAMLKKLFDISEGKTGGLPPVVEKAVEVVDAARTAWFGGEDAMAETIREDYARFARSQSGLDTETIINNAHDDSVISDPSRALAAIFSTAEAKEVLAKNPALAAAFNLEDSETFDSEMFSIFREYATARHDEISGENKAWHWNSKGEWAYSPHDYIDFSKAISLLEALSVENITTAEALQKFLNGVVTVEENGG